MGFRCFKGHSKGHLPSPCPSGDDLFLMLSDSAPKVVGGNRYFGVKDYVFFSFDQKMKLAGEVM